MTSTVGHMISGMHRRAFLQSLAASLALPSIPMQPGGGQPLGSTSRPAWDWIPILDFAARHGFVSIELRGIQKAMDLTERPEFGAARIPAVGERRRTAGFAFRASAARRGCTKRSRTCGRHRWTKRGASSTSRPR